MIGLMGVPHLGQVYYQQELDHYAAVISLGVFLSPCIHLRLELYGKTGGCMCFD